MIEALFALDGLTLVVFMAASVALYLTPGADMMFIMASGMAGGRRAGVAAAFGVSIGSLFHVALAAGGVAALIAAHPLAYDTLRFVGAAYLIWLAVQAWRAPALKGTADGSRNVWPAFRRGALTNMLNPKVSIFVLAFLPQFVDPDAGPVWLQIAVLGCIFSFASIPFNCAYGALAGAFGARIRQSERLMNRISAFVFGGLAARLVIAD